MSAISRRRRLRSASCASTGRGRAGRRRVALSRVASTLAAPLAPALLLRGLALVLVAVLAPAFATALTGTLAARAAAAFGGAFLGVFAGAPTSAMARMRRWRSASRVATGSRRLARLPAAPLALLAL